MFFYANSSDLFATTYVSSAAYTVCTWIYYVDDVAWYGFIPVQVGHAVVVVVVAQLARNEEEEFNEEGMVVVWMGDDWNSDLWALNECNILQCVSFADEEAKGGGGQVVFRSSASSTTTIQLQDSNRLILVFDFSNS